jgi:hypothetical protein
LLKNNQAFVEQVDGVVAAPWRLHGTAWLLPQLHPVKQVDMYVPSNCQIVAGFGYTPGGYVLVRYWTSPVGPYNEVMFIPALIKHASHYGFHVSHIYVDNQASVDSGRANWWLPKQMLHYSVRAQRQMAVFEAYSDNANVCRATFAHMIRCCVPFTTAFLPLMLLQERDGSFRQSRVSAKGRVTIANGLFNILDQTILPQVRPCIRFPLLHLPDVRLWFDTGIDV